MSYSRPVEIAPSILSADFSRLGDQIRSVEKHAGRIHVDVMDGHFVPNLSMGPVVVKSIRPVTRLPIEVHLMVEEPARFVRPFAEAGADRLVFHLEAVDDPSALAAEIRRTGRAAGIAVNPATAWRGVEPYLEDIDLVILMTVNPGFGAQAFIEEVIPKLAEASARIGRLHPHVDIEVDGGIDSASAPRAKKAGANVFVAGNAIFGRDDPEAAIRELVTSVGRGA